MHALVVSFAYIMHIDCFTISGDHTLCDWKFAIINFVITKYHKIIINFFENVAFFKFSFIDI